MASIRPYNISIPNSALAELKAKLSSASFPDELHDAEWEYGVPVAEMERLVSYWKDTFDWRKSETSLNDLPNYQCTIQVEGFDPLQIHFVHYKSKVANAIPLLFIHGCLSTTHSQPPCAR